MIPKSMFSKELLSLEDSYRNNSREFHSVTMEKSGVPLLLGIIILTLNCVQGIPTMKSQRCYCINTSTKIMKINSLKSLEKYPPTSFCNKTEIIAIMKNGAKTCLNPNSAKVKSLLRAWKRKSILKNKQMKGKIFAKNRKAQKLQKSQQPHQKKTT